jgi:hypothetical protein
MVESMKETPVQQRVRLRAAYMNIELWRNNSGVLKNEFGTPVRYGLANDSAALNKAIKSSDLIGVMPVVITADMVGKTVGVFVAAECKPTDWHLTPGDERGQAQARFHGIVRKAGGIAGFVTSEEDFISLITL